MRGRKTGMILIAIGIFLPLFLLFFVTGYKADAGIIKNLYGVKVMILFPPSYPISIPYRYILAIGVVLIFLGVRSMDINR
ncbi:MAG: hypothetical protein N2745_11420 [Syntrophorhabdaceae bacterium]|nr:hypothetical protein [Syntrophorhabdaceae bacterium]